MALTIGWLSDDPIIVGGAEYSNDELLDYIGGNPAFTIVRMPAGSVSAGVDGYVLHNTTSYGRDIIPLLEKKPFVKLCADKWVDGDPVLRGYVLSNAAIVSFNSPLALRTFPHRVDAPRRIFIKSIIKDKGWGEYDRREGTYVWLGRRHLSKGLAESARWAEQNNITIDVYASPEYPPGALKGPLNNCFSVEPEMVQGTLRRYETFVFHPQEIESYSRTTVEAWLAGCELEVNNNIGALHWIENEPNHILNGDIGGIVWKAIEDALTGVPDVSVIVPCFGCEDTAEKALRSALDQTGVRVEVIALNAGCSQGISDIITEINDHRLTQMSTITDPGLGVMNNAGMEVARGRYIQYLEGDDWLEPGSLSRLALALDANPSKLFVYGQVQYHGDRTDLFIPAAFNRNAFKTHNPTLYPIMWRREAKARWHDFEAGIGLNDRDFIMQLAKEGDGLAVPDTLVLHYTLDTGGAWAKMQEYMPELLSELKSRHPEILNA